MREAPEKAVGLDRRAGKRGLRGKRGRMRCFSEAVGGVSVRKIPIRRLVLAGLRGFTAKFICREHSFPNRFAKKFFGSGCFLRPMGGVRDSAKNKRAFGRNSRRSPWTAEACCERGKPRFHRASSVPIPPGSQQGCIAQRLQRAVAVQGAQHSASSIYFWRSPLVQCLHRSWGSGLKSAFLTPQNQA